MNQMSETHQTQRDLRVSDGGALLAYQLLGRRADLYQGWQFEGC